MGFERLGVECRVDGDDLIVPAKQSRQIQSDLGGHVPKLEDQPWPAFPADVDVHRDRDRDAVRRA